MISSISLIFPWKTNLSSLLGNFIDQDSFLRGLYRYFKVLNIFILNFTDFTKIFFKFHQFHICSCWISHFYWNFTFLFEFHRYQLILCISAILLINLRELQYSWVKIQIFFFSSNEKQNFHQFSFQNVLSHSF